MAGDRGGAGRAASVDATPRMLVLGGSGLLGTAIVRAAIDAGWHVTSVHRGGSSARLGAGAAGGGEGAEALIEVVFDRADGHEALDGMSFDAVIDNAGYLPAVVRDAARTLGPRSGHWVYVSSISAHADHRTPGQGADAQLLDLENAWDGPGDPFTDLRFDLWAAGLYGHCKAACEQLLVDELGARRVASIRPVVMAGLHDTTWRFDYWVDRFLDGGDVLAPAPASEPVALVDARDVAQFAVRCCADEVAGDFVMAPDPMEATFAQLMAGCEQAARELGAPAARVHWAPTPMLEAAGVEPWAGLPFWLPEATGSRGMNVLDSVTARAAGFATRSIVETARWVMPAVRTRREAGPIDVPDRIDVPDLRLTRAREAELVSLSGAPA